jgi:YesN/AraC family two-component response regulator
MNFQTWLNTLRIEESKIHLTSGEKISIEEIGVRVGIPQPYNFSRWFRVLEGTTPYRYKKEHSNNPTH